MAHGLNKRLLRFLVSPPRLSASQVFAVGTDQWGNPIAYAAIKMAGEFHAVPCQATRPQHGEPEGTVEWSPQVETFGEVYAPVHPDMTIEDVEGARYPHDDGTQWLFAHCSPKEQIDFAADVENYARAEMQDAINRAMLALQIAPAGATRTAARDKVDSLGEFSRAVAQNAHQQVTAATLGYWHRNPHEDHRRDIAVAAIETVLALWDTLGEVDSDAGRAISASRTRVLPDARGALTRLKQEHAIEWRHVRQKRLDDAEAAKGTDPVAGYEYVYASSLFPAVITGEANLPSPTWFFDALRHGNVIRGVYRYSDGEPTPTRFMPWVIRFKRPVPEGTQPGANIGSVAWEQETAYAPTPPPTE